MLSGGVPPPLGCRELSRHAGFMGLTGEPGGDRGRPGGSGPGRERLSVGFMQRFELQGDFTRPLMCIKSLWRPPALRYEIQAAQNESGIHLKVRFRSFFRCHMIHL